MDLAGPLLDVLAWGEVDFVLLRRGGDAIAVECKASERGFDATNLAAFRRRYPKGPNDAQGLRSACFRERPSRDGSGKVTR